MKVWIRGLAAISNASQHREISFSMALASPATVTERISLATWRTDSKSPSEAMGNPASMTSTRSDSNWWASFNFSSRFMLHPGDCSPSLKVVSKICMVSSIDSPLVLLACPSRKKRLPL